MKQILIILILLLSFNSFSQLIGVVPEKKNDVSDEKSIVTLGVLQGGGSLVGADFEFLVGEKLGLQIGAGLVGFGAAVNYHLKPSIRSSFISLSYWHQGVGEGTSQELFGPSFVFRGKKWFTFNVGLAYALSKGPAWPDDTQQSPVQLTYGVGVYLPL